MKRLLAAAALTVTMFSSGMALAAEKTVTLAVENMYCPSCPYIVKKSLTAVPGVLKAEVSLEKKTAIVTYDDEKTTIEAMTNATFDAGYPSDLAK